MPVAWASAIEPLTLPAGFEWRTDIALLAGVAAKEAVVSTMGTAYSLGDVDPEDAQNLGQLFAEQPQLEQGHGPFPDALRAAVLALLRLPGGHPA